RLESRVLGFFCVYLPKQVQDAVGPLDERFSGYGFEDNDYCARVLAAGLKLGIWDVCVVDHSGEFPSTFRNRPDIWSLYARNWRLFRDKWGERLCPPGMELAEKAAYLDERLLAERAGDSVS